MRTIRLGYVSCLHFREKSKKIRNNMKAVLTKKKKIITIGGPVINATNEGMKEVRHSLSGLERHRFQPQRTLDECYDLDDMRLQETTSLAR